MPASSQDLSQARIEVVRLRHLLELQGSSVEPVRHISLQGFSFRHTLIERQPAGFQISMARRITLRDTSIYDCVRAGINISEGTWGGHLIERCDIFDTVLVTHDHGSFNSWGAGSLLESKAPRNHRASR